MSLEHRTIDRIVRDFAENERASVSEILATYCGPEATRVVWDVLELSKGNVEQVRHFVRAAQSDYRDVLYWAEYYATDPMLRGRDPEQMAREMLAKLGDRR